MKDLVEKVTSGDVRTVARLIRDVDDGMPEVRDALKALYPHTGKAYIIGITGAPGVGKSTLVDQMVAHLRKRGKTVGVLAVDPTSPFSGGAILGDRVRMQRHSMDPGVFIRSLATRGHFGGLTQSTRSAIDILDAMGKDVILVETVGVGQDEVDVVRSAPYNGNWWSSPAWGTIFRPSRRAFWRWGIFFSSTRVTVKGPTKPSTNCG